jgi:hypothetical protein
MSLNWKTISAYMMTSTSILGAAVATPAFVGAVTGTITWREAALPLLGAVISLLIPQRLSPPADAKTLLVAVDKTANVLATAAEASPNATVREVASVVPEITQELESAFAAWQAANDRLATAKVVASAQAAKINTSLAKTAPLSMPTGPEMAAKLASARLAPAPAPTEADLALMNASAPAYTPAS